MRRIQGRLWVSASELSASSPSTFMRLDELELEVILILSMLARARLADDLKTSSEATDSPETKALGLKMIFLSIYLSISFFISLSIYIYLSIFLSIKSNPWKQFPQVIVLEPKYK